MRVVIRVLTGVLMVLAPIYAEEDVVMQAMRDELSRSMDELRLEALERPYFIAYRVEESWSTRVSASFGSLLGSNEGRGRSLSVEVRVGDYDFDNTNFRASRFGGFRGRAGLPLDDDYKALRRQIWLATDRMYKQAVEDLSGKRAALQHRTRTEEIPDFSRESPASIADEAAPVAVDLAEAERLVRDLSALFRQMPDVFMSTVRLSVNNARTRYLNSEGTSFTRLTPSVTFTALAGTQAPDGMPLEDFVAVYGRSMGDLPGVDELKARIEAMGARLSELRDAPVVDTYTGPVLLEEQAAAALFGRVFAPRLLASRAPISGGGRGSGRGRNPFLDKIGARVLPEFLSVVDDPTVREYKKRRLVGGARVDDDGVRTRKTVLVEKGFLNTLLATRNPVSGIAKSTGSRHGSNALPSNLFVTAKKGYSDKKMKKAFLKLVKQRKNGYGIIVRRIGNSSLRVPGLGRARRRGARVADIILAYRVFPNGREELIRNAGLSDIDAATFKEIVAASKAQTVYSAPFRTRSASGSHSGVVSFVAPSLLFEDVTLQKPRGEIPHPPVASHPAFDR